MVGTPQPLIKQYPISNPDGTPTDYFIRWAQERQIDIKEGISAAEAEQLIIDYLALHQLQEGTGIDISPSGSLADDPTISLDAVLDDLNDVDTVTTPPTDGQALLWNDGDQLWEPGDVAAAGGGGGSLTQIAQIVLTAAAASIDFQNISQDYDDLVIVWQARGDTAAGLTNVRARLNNDSGANYDGEEIHAYSSGTNFTQYIAQTWADIGNMAANTADAGRSGFGVITIPSYARTSFMKQMLCNWGNSYSTGTFTQGNGQYSSTWRNTAAVNRFTLLPNAGNFAAGTVCTIYGRGKTPKVWPGNVIAEYVCTGGETSIDFPNIPQTFRDLRLSASVRGTVAAANSDLRVQYNGDTGTNYTHQLVSGNNTGAGATAGVSQTSSIIGSVAGNTAPAGSASTTSLDIPNYSSVVFNKSFTSQSSLRRGTGAADLFILEWAGNWINTAAINRVTLIPASGAFATGTRVTLYGLGGPGGATIYNRPWYWKPPLVSQLQFVTPTVNIVAADDPDVGLICNSGTPATGGSHRCIFFPNLTNPSLDWDFKCRFNWEMDPLNTAGLGIVYRDSVGGRLQWLAWRSEASDQLMFVNSDSLTSVNAVTATAPMRGYSNWMRFQKVGSTISWYLSTDGKNWRLLQTQAATVFLANAPNQVGFICYMDRATQAPYWSIDHMSLTGPAV